MFKFLLLLFLIIYIVAKLGGFIMRMLFSGYSGQTRQQSYQSGGQRKPKDGNVNIDFNPNDSRRSKSSGNFKGGDYVNYEEVE